MGSFIGHVDEATFFIILAFWWMFNKFPRYVKSPSNYDGRLSYGLPCRQKLPIEAIFKTLFPFCGLIAELANGKGPHFINEKGQFQKLDGVQHITIYGIFILHGIADILTYCKIKIIPPGFDYFTAALSFAWYGIAFRWHATMPGKAPLETVVHLLPTYIMFLAAAITIIEYWKGGLFSLNLVRIWCLLVLGTWFVHTSFVMYLPWGGIANPKWDRHDHHNVHFIVAMFGAHCCLHLFTITIVYAISYAIIPRSPGADRHKNGRETYNCLEECEILIDESTS